MIPKVSLQWYRSKTFLLFFEVFSIVVTSVILRKSKYPDMCVGLCHICYTYT
nr:MAG TPA: Ig Ig domain of plant-specific actin-binding protein [Bacteriophage sp.]